MKLQEMKLQNRSLFRRLLFGFIAVMMLIWLANLVLDVYETRTSKRRDMQRELRASALRILVVMQTMGERRPDEIKPAVHKMEQLHYALYKELGWYTPHLQTQVWRRGELLYVSPEAGLPVTDVAAGPYHQATHDGWVASVETDPETGVTVRMTTEVIGEWMLQTSSVGYYFAPLLFSVPFLLLPAWFIIRVGLRPLKSIVGEIEERSATDLSPLAPSPYQELSPLVGSVNRLMERLTERLEREQEFLVDAAHELKTPLSIIQINADSLSDSLTAARTPQRLEEAGQGLRAGVQRATHTVHQLLALARSGGDRDHASPTPRDLVELVADRLALAGQIAVTRGIEIELQAPDRLVMPLHLESMASLIDNLVSNAVKYSPPGGRITVRIVATEGSIAFSVADQGPGIPPDMQRKVFERFFRMPDQDQPGSGLGLAIAERAAARNQGAIRLVNLADGGLRVDVIFTTV
jgi:two-component system sensor histidine kinase QseC